MSVAFKWSRTAPTECVKWNENQTEAKVPLVLIAHVEKPWLTTLLCTLLNHVYIELPECKVQTWFCSVGVVKLKPDVLLKRLIKIHFTKIHSPQCKTTNREERELGFFFFLLQVDFFLQWFFHWTVGVWGAPVDQKATVISSLTLIIQPLPLFGAVHTKLPRTVLAKRSAAAAAADAAAPWLHSKSCVTASIGTYWLIY